MQARDCEPGDEVLIRALVVKQNGGQTMMFCPGIGRGGKWSVVNSVDVEKVAGLTAPMMKSLMDREGA